ncbi:hypothetical protein IC575_003346 [Cucumis melo]
MAEHKNIFPQATKNCSTNPAKLFHILLMKMPVNSHGGVHPIVWFLQEEEQCAFLCQEGRQVSRGGQKVS